MTTVVLKKTPKYAPWCERSFARNDDADRWAALYPGSAYITKDGDDEPPLTVESMSTPGRPVGPIQGCDPRIPPDPGCVALPPEIEDVEADVVAQYVIHAAPRRDSPEVGFVQVFGADGACMASALGEAIGPDGDPDDLYETLSEAVAAVRQAASAAK